MFLNVRQIESSGREVNCQIRPRPLTTSTGRIIPFGEITLRGRVTPRRGGYRFQGHIMGHGTFECARCLEPFAQKMHSDFDLFFSGEAPGAQAAEFENGLEDVENPSLLVGEQIDLDALVSEQLYLNLPLKPLCGADCRGLCPVCGANQNLAACGCEETEQAGSLATPLGSLGPRRQH